MACGLVGGVMFALGGVFVLAAAVELWLVGRA